MAKRGPGKLSKAHKDALASGRSEAVAVKAYLEALDRNKPRRGRPRTVASVQGQLDKVRKALIDAAPLERLQLTQQRMDLERDLKAMQSTQDLAALEKAFVRVAKAYSERKGISVAAWRELGVSAAVLRPDVAIVTARAFSFSTSPLMMSPSFV